jgi:signal transduction histidine kinase/ActR/RegA family two-component response regulator
MRYGVALLAIVLATLARLLVDGILGDHLCLTTYLLAVLFTARYAGFGPAVLTLLLGVVVGDFFFMPPRGGWFEYDFPQQFEIGLYFLLGAPTVVLSGSLYSAQARAKATAAEALARQHRLEAEIDTRLATEDALRESEYRYRIVAEQLQTANRRKDEFLAMLGHELRNPLAPISSALTLLQLIPCEDEARREYYDLMQRHLKQLTHIVDDLLDVSRIMQGKISLKPERIDLRDIVRQGVETCRELVNEMRHELEVDLPARSVPVEADAVRLTQVVVNLLNNAAKYTPPGGKITISLRRESRGVLLQVRDNGAGIAPEILPKVFDLFTQADSSLDRAAGGLGIGLTVVKTLVEMHGGDIAVASAGLGHGATFSVRLPAIAEVSVQPAPENATPSLAPPVSVLVIEDNVVAANMLATLLRKAWGHDVQIAHDGVAGIEAANMYEFDIILIDIGLPGLSGYDVARRLRRNPSTRNLLLVALTGYGQAEDRSHSASAGFDLHLVKPASIDVLDKAFRHAKLAASRADRLKAAIG